MARRLIWETVGGYHIEYCPDEACSDEDSGHLSTHVQYDFGSSMPVEQVVQEADLAYKDSHKHAVAAKPVKKFHDEMI